MSRALALALAALASCAWSPRDAGVARIEGSVAERVAGLELRGAETDDAAALRAVDGLLASPLTADAAVQVAFLVHPGLLAAYAELDIARADLVQAGLLANPVFDARVRFPDGPPRRAGLELTVVQDFLDVLTLAARRDLAGAAFDAEVLALAGRLVERAYDVRAAYYRALGDAQVAEVRRLVAEASATSAELARRIHEAGNASDLDLELELGLYEDARIAWARAEAERVESREALVRAMGLWGTRAAAWHLPASLPELPAADPSLEELEPLALGRRLDLAAALRRADVLAARAGVERRYRLLPSLSGGASGERDSDGSGGLGPELSLGVPLFDTGGARAARRTAELRLAEREAEALAVEARSEVRAARERLRARRRLAEHLRDVVVPLRESIVRRTQEQQAYMLMGAFELIRAKEAEYDAYQQYLEALRDYWTARADLGRALGGDPPAGAAAAAAGPEHDAARHPAARHEDEPHHSHGTHGG